MSENRMQYLSRNYDEYKNELRNITRKYYPDVFDNLDDASIGQWFIDILADIGDNLQFHIDRVFQETSIDSASQLSSLHVKYLYIHKELNLTVIYVELMRNIVLI